MKVAKTLVFGTVGFLIGSVIGSIIGKVFTGSAEGLIGLVFGCLGVWAGVTLAKGSRRGGQQDGPGEHVG